MNHRNWARASLIELLDYIEQHHCEIREKMLKSQTLIEQASDSQKKEYGSAFDSLQKFFPDFKIKIENHFANSTAGNSCV